MYWIRKLIHHVHSSYKMWFLVHKVIQNNNNLWWQYEVHHRSTNYIMTTYGRRVG